MFEDTKEETKSRQSKKERQHSGQKKRHKSTTNYLQNIAQKTKD